MENRKIRVGFVSNCPAGAKTGLGRNMKAITTLLFKSGKYELFFLSQGMHDNSAEFTKLPFHCEGVFKNYNQQLFQTDQGYQRFVAYGNTAVEQFVLNNKLDCLILSDDQWAFDNNIYINSDWFKYMNSNILPIITADSLPILPTIKEWAEKCKNMSFWTNFAGKALIKENPDKFKHCKTIYGAIQSEDFKPLPPGEKMSLRRQFNIQDDEKVIIYLGRNQLRKIFAAHIKGLAKYKKQNPKNKIKLLFHCSWSEPHGWPLNQMREQYGLSPEDILTTYYCRKCNHWEVRPFTVEDIDCPHCKEAKSMITAGVGSTINEVDLNKIYNLADGSASIFTSGAFEYTNAESLLSGLPLACPNYSCGEDFCGNDFIYEIKGGLTWEHNSGFEKFVPDINSVVKFFDYVYNMTEKEKNEIALKGRAWAKSNFDVTNVVKKYEEFIDNCKPIDWETFYQKRTEIKNVNAPIENKQNDDEFILECYKKILNMTPDDKDSGFQYWKNFLSQKEDKNKLKESMVNSMRSAAVEHNRKVSQPITLDHILNVPDKKKIGIVMPESIGDVFLTTSLLESIRDRYPKDEWHLSFITKPEFFDILDCNKFIDLVIPYSQEFDNLLVMEGNGGHKGYFDVLYQPHFGTQRLLSYMHNGIDKHDLNLTK